MTTIPNPHSLFYRSIDACPYGAYWEQETLYQESKARLLELVKAIRKSQIQSKPLRRAIKNAWRTLRVGKTSKRMRGAAYRLALAFNTTVRLLVNREVKP